MHAEESTSFPFGSAQGQDGGVLICLLALVLYGITATGFTPTKISTGAASRILGSSFRNILRRGFVPNGDFSSALIKSSCTWGPAICTPSTTFHPAERFSRFPRWSETCMPAACKADKIMVASLLPSVSRAYDLTLTTLPANLCMTSLSALCSSKLRSRGWIAASSLRRANFSPSVCSISVAIFTSLSLSFAASNLDCASAAWLVRVNASRVVTTINMAAKAATARPHNIKLFQKSAALDSCSTCEVSAWISPTFSFSDIIALSVVAICCIALIAA